MTNNTSIHTLNFAAQTKTGPELFKAYKDFWKHTRANQGVKNVTFALTDDAGNPISYDQKENAINKMLKDVIIERSGVPYVTTETPVEQWFSHPNIQHETFAVVSMLIDMILPETLIEDIGIFSEVRNISWGDSASFVVKPRDLFPVSIAGRDIRTAELQRQYNGMVTLIPIMHQVSVQVSLFRVLSGVDSLADFTTKCVQSIETQMTIDAYSAFATAFDALDTSGNTQLKATGYTQAQLVSFCQTVETYNQGSKPLIVGTNLALSNVIPLDGNYRYDLTGSDYVKIGHIPTAFGYDLLMLPQVAKWATPFTKVISDSRLWIVSPSSQKIVKVVVEGNTLSNVTGAFDGSMLQQSSTLWKSWTTGVATNAIGAEIVLS